MLKRGTLFTGSWAEVQIGKLNAKNAKTGGVLDRYPEHQQLVMLSAGTSREAQPFRLALVRKGAISSVSRRSA